jgi:hypothetical protein
VRSQTCFWICSCCACLLFRHDVRHVAYGRHTAIILAEGIIVPMLASFLRRFVCSMHVCRLSQLQPHCGCEPLTES